MSAHESKWAAALRNIHYKLYYWPEHTYMTFSGWLASQSFSHQMKGLNRKMETSSIDGIMLDFVADQQSQYGNNNPLSKIEQMCFFFGSIFS